MKRFSGRLFLAIQLAAMPYILCAGGAVDYAIYRTGEQQASLPATDPALFAANAITPKQAENDMRDALQMLDIPSSFKHPLHHLLLKLKHCVHKKNAVWTDESLGLYMQLARFQTLFTMLAQQSVPQGTPAVMLGIDRAGTVPENACMTLPNTVNNPVWQAVRGKNFAAAVILLPCQYHLKGSLAVSPAVSAVGSGSVAVKLQKVEYFLHNNRWSHRLSSDNHINRGSGMEIFLLRAGFDQSLAPGIYLGSITFTPADNAQPIQLKYTIVLN